MRKLEQIYTDNFLSHRARTVYIYLHDRSDKEGKSWPALGTICLLYTSGRSTGPHLHLEVIRDGVPQNPRNYL